MVFHNNLVNLQRMTQKFNKRETKTQLQLLARALGNMVNRVLNLQIYQKKNIFMSELEGARQQIAIVLQKE
jgi:uncharacterized protein YejL (UPF0352 family)